MELTGKRFCMISDKEQLLKILNLNNVPSIELVHPKTCSYPIVGRLFGHDGGRNLGVIHTKEQALDEGYDYYTKLYSLEKEYYLEIESLAIKKAYIAVGEHVILHDIPIRTGAFGWRWKETDISEWQEELKNLAIRALYVTGLRSGFVKLGELAGGSFIVTDVNPAKDKDMEPIHKVIEPFTLGADVEFMLSCEGELLPASDFFPIDGGVGCDARQIEQDSGEYALAEIRPEQADNPHDLFRNIESLIHKASEMVPFKNIEFCAGSMPFYGYQVGGHIHFGTPLSLSLLKALDYYLAIPVSMVETPNTARRRRKTKHGGLGRYREKSYGFEYLTLSSWIINPKLTMSVICLSRLIVIHHHELKSDLLFHPLVQQAYYQGNRIFLKQLWGDIKEALMNTSSFMQYENELGYLFEAIEEGYLFAETEDIRNNWGIQPHENLYDRGLVIQIPKKMRQKFKFQEGQKAFVCAGKNISQAEICAYPFAFRYRNTVYLSDALRERLSIPKNWNPRITSVNGVISLGPIIGILASRPFDRQTTYFQHLGRLAHEKQMLVYVFEPDDINWEQQLIKGTTIEGEGYFPFPAVIYDRFFYDGECEYDIDEIRTKLETVYNIPFVNPVTLFRLTGDKWNTHKLLSDEFAEFLPETRLLQGVSDVTELLDSYGDIYLKPVGGALGMGIIRVIRRPAGIFWISSRQKAYERINDIQELEDLVSDLMNQTPYIVQEGIRRKQHGRRNLEIRVYMQKNGGKKWLRTGMVARLAAEDMLTAETESNMRVSKVLQLIYPDPALRRQIVNRMADITRDVVLAVEREVGDFGELAVDLCIDQYDSIKIVEINSKPDNLFSQIKAYKLRSLAGIRLLNYAASLAGYLDEN